MKVTTLRFPESMYEALEAEAEAEEKSLSEYVRGILRERENTQPNTAENTQPNTAENTQPNTAENTQPNTSEYDDRLRDLEQRIDELEEELAEPESTEPRPEPAARKSPGEAEELVHDPGGETPENTTLNSESPPEQLVELVTTDDVPGQGEKAERRREAVRASLEYIRENRKATPSDLRENIYPEYKGDYTTGQNPQRSWWKNCVYPALRDVAEQDPRLEKGDTRGIWSYKPEEGSVYDPTTEF